MKANSQAWNLSMHLVPDLNIYRSLGGRGDSAAVKSACCLSGEPEFGSYHPHQVAHIYLELQPQGI